MISDEITFIPTERIIVDPWRRPITAAHVEDLVSSIVRVGLIHTIVVDPQNHLAVGGHRLEAFKRLAALGAPCPFPEYHGWTCIPARVAEDFTDEELARIELIENLQHRQLTWEEEVRGYKRIHDLQVAREGAKWSELATAELLHVNHATVSKALRVEPHLEDPDISACTTLSSAFNIVQRRAQREKADVLEKIITGGGVKEDIAVIAGVKEAPPHEPDPVAEGERNVELPDLPLEHPIRNESFLDFAREWNGPRFNFLHCDFPYGINLTDSPGQNSAKDSSTYDDSPEVYWALLNALASNRHTLLAASCHILFWFSQNLRRETEDFFAREMPEFSVNPFLMIWHRSDNSGLLPDPQRYGRRNYETAFLLTSGDRKIVKAKSLCFAYGNRPDDKLHRSEKPIEVLSHFMSMFVDSSSRVLDPTCGSGTSIRVAHDLGASTHIGIELDPDMVKRAQKAYNIHTAKRVVA